MSTVCNGLTPRMPRIADFLCVLVIAESMLSKLAQQSYLYDTLHVLKLANVLAQTSCNNQMHCLPAPQQCALEDVLRINFVIDVKFSQSYIDIFFEIWVRC